MKNLKEKEIELKSRAYKLIEKTKKYYKNYLDERKFLLSIEYLDLKSEDDYEKLNSQITEIEKKFELNIKTK